jgi:hypothetical protein
MRTVTVAWQVPDEYHVRLDRTELVFKDKKASVEIDTKEHYLSWSAWGKPSTPYAFEVSVNGVSIYKTPQNRRIGKKQVAFGAITIKAAL